MKSPDSEITTAADLAGRLARLQALVLGEPERARIDLQEIMEQARSIGAYPQEALALLELGRCSFLQGQYKDMLEFAQEALSLSRSERISNLESRALNSIGLAYQRMGLLDQAMEFFISSLKLAQQILDKEATAKALSNIALVHTTLGEYQIALQLHEQALEMAQNSGHAIYTANLLASLLEDHFYLENHDRVLEMSDEAVSFSKNHGFSRFECSTRASLSKSLLALGRNKASLRIARIGLRVARWTKDQEMTATLLWISGQALYQLGEKEKATKDLLDGLSECQDSGDKEQEIKIHLTLANIYESNGNFDKGAEHRQKCAEINELFFGSEAQQRTQMAVIEFKELQRPDTQYLHVWSSELHELTKSLKRANTEMAYRMAHDPLTGAMNRPHFQARVQKILDGLGNEEIIGFVFLSLDQMKTVNEVFGPVVGDSLLAEVAERLRNILRAGDLIGRLGSDEFVILLDFLGESKDLHFVMQKIFNAISKPYYIRGQQIHMTASLGGVIAPQDAQTLESLFGNADLALQQVKASGRNGMKIYEANLSHEEQNKRSLGYNLRHAQEKNELRLYYQGQFRFPTKELTGFEALIRWQHPELGLLSPAHFIDIAEENRLILDIGYWVLNEACRQAVLWDFANLGLKMSVNVSALQFDQLDFVSGVQAALKEHDLPGRCLILEITESLVQKDEELTCRHIEALSELGVGVALDDFGTGFSNLSLLHTLNLQILKIDRSFLKEFQTDSIKFKRSRIMLETLINLAHNMEMSVIAEGIEQSEQFDLLHEMSCDEAQGYLLSRPVPSHEAEALLTEKSKGSLSSSNS